VKTGKTEEQLPLASRKEIFLVLDYKKIGLNKPEALYRALERYFIKSIKSIH
jgi:hypothetical protein